MKNFHTVLTALMLACLLLTGVCALQTRELGKSACAAGNAPMISLSSPNPSADVSREYYRADTSQKLYDYTGILTPEQQEKLKKRLQKLTRNKKMNVILVITDDLLDLTPEAFANSFYDRNHFGIGETESGILLLIDRSGRTLWLSAAGQARELYDSRKIDGILEKLVAPASFGDYYAVCGTFLTEIEEPGKWLAVKVMCIGLLAAILYLIIAYYLQPSKPAIRDSGILLKREDFFCVSQLCLKQDSQVKTYSRQAWEEKKRREETERLRKKAQKPGWRTYLHDFFYGKWIQSWKGPYSSLRGHSGSHMGSHSGGRGGSGRKF